MPTQKFDREPWVRDLAALGDSTKRDMPSLARTVDQVLASTTPNPSQKERIMTKLKRKPLLVAAVCALALALAAPVAYAVVQKLFLTIDPSQSAEEMKEDLSGQLEAQGIQGATVEVEKSGDSTIVAIDSEGEELAGAIADIQVDVAGEESAQVERREWRLEVQGQDDLSEDELAALRSAVTSPDFGQLARGPEEGESDDDYVAAIEAFFAEHGFADTEVTVSEAKVLVLVR